jgi:hypothetical protein
MATDWEQERRDAYNDFADEGFPLTVIKPGDPGVYDPISDDWTGGTPDETWQTYGLQKSLTMGAVLSLVGYSEGGTGSKLYQKGDTVLYIPALGLPDDLDDRFLIEYRGKKKVIAEAIAYAPGDVPLIFQLLIREPKNSKA